MLRVSVTSDTLREQKGTSKTTGKPYNMVFQTVWVHTLDRNGVKNPYPEKTEIILERAEDGAAVYYRPGEYQLAPSSFYIDRQGNLAVAPRLVAIKAEPKPNA
jgi:hypothetical protein